MANLRLNAVVIEEDKNDPEKKYYHSIGSAFPHPDNNGFDILLKINPNDGNFSLFIPKENEEVLGLSNETHLEVSVVESKKKEDGSYDNFYNRIGVGYVHENDRGINVKLIGSKANDKDKLVIRRPKAKEESQD